MPCAGQSTGIQAAGQDAANLQDAMSSAKSKQFMPQNVNKSLRLKSGFDRHKSPSRDMPADGSAGDVSQENNSSAASKALNLNGLWQGLMQTQDPSGGEVIII